MVVFPNCKINLGLSILDKRSDGFHNLKTVFYPLQIKDVVEIIPASSLSSDPGNVSPVLFSTSGIPIDGSAANNLCLKAYHLLRQDFPDLPPVLMHLHKAIPMGAGLGGGSSDGAFVLQTLNSIFKLELSPSQLISYALQLGSDCPFFILNHACIASGRGEIMQPITLDLSAYTFVLVNAGILVNTGWAFGQLKQNQQSPGNTMLQPKDLINQPVHNWKEFLKNDFEIPVFEQYPVLSTIKSKLYELGAIYAAMSGSGSTIFGIFEKGKAPAQLVGMDGLQLWAVQGGEITGEPK